MKLLICERKMIFTSLYGRESSFTNKLYDKAKEFRFFPISPEYFSFLSQEGLSRKESISKYNIIFKESYVSITCSYCNNPVKITFRSLLDRISSKWFPHKMTCRDKACLKLKQQEINSHRSAIGQSPCQGKVVTAEETAKRLKTTAERYPNGTQFHRKGKSFIEQFGVDMAKEIHEKQSYHRKLQCGDKEPHLNKPHSEETKERMSKRKKEFFSSGESRVKKHVHPETGELLDWHEWDRFTVTRWNDALSDSDRAVLLKRYVDRFFDNDGNYKIHSKTGYVKHWFLEKDQKYDSSLEEAYYKKLNHDRKFWVRNRIIYIPYISSKDSKLHYYIPDVLIYTDDTFNILESIVEVKPFEFVNNPNNRDGMYYKITKDKLSALKDFCSLNNVSDIIITEGDVSEYYENKTNYKEKL